jgi:hypothetical protein
MLTGIDHVILASTDPGADALELERRVGLRATGGGRHEAHGTFNRLCWMGDSYVELMGVFDETLAKGSWWGAHMLGRLEAGGGYAGMALASDDLAADIDRLRGLGSALSDPIAGQRIRPDGDVVRWAIGRPPTPDPELGLVFLIEHDTSSAEWRPADRAARAAETHPLGGPASLFRVELPVADTARATMRLLRDLGLQFRPSLAGAGARDTTIGTQTLRLTPAGTAGAPSIGVRGGSPARTEEVLGCRWEVVPS